MEPDARAWGACPGDARRLDELTELILGVWGLRSRLAPTGGETAWNFTATLDDGRRLFVKCSLQQPGVAADLEARILNRILTAAPEAVVPAPLPARDESLATSWGDRSVWITTFCEGEPFEPDAADRQLRRRAGAALAEIDGALAQAPEAAEVAPTPWNLASAADTISELAAAPTDSLDDAALLLEVLTQFVADVLPELEERPQQLIHNDLNADNLLVSDGRPSAVLDFGDAVVGSRVQDLGTALAYLCGDSDLDTVIATMAEVVSGYQLLAPMETDDLLLLPAVARARCAFALARTRLNAIGHPPGAHRDYILRNEARSARRLDLLLQSPVTEQGRRLAALLDSA